MKRYLNTSWIYTICPFQPGMGGTMLSEDRLKWSQRSSLIEIQVYFFSTVDALMGDAQISLSPAIRGG